jgi:hypothetical protein
MKSHNSDAAFPSMTKPTVIRIGFMNKMNLSTLNSDQPLKFLNRLLNLRIEVDDAKNGRYIPGIGISTSELDFANMNRMTVVYI